MNKDNVGASRSSPAFVNRQTALARLRDDVCLQEQCAAAELASAGRQAGPAPRALAEAARTTRILKKARAAAAVRQQRRDQLRRDVFGRESLFTEAAQGGVQGVPSPKKR